MAGLGTLLTKNITLVSASGPLTLLQLIAPTNQGLILKQCEVSMNGITAADPSVYFDVVVETTAGTMSSATAAIAKRDATMSESIQMTAQHTATVTPTATDIKWGGYYHEMTGGVIPLKNIRIPGGTRLGIRYTSGTLTATTKCAISVEVDE